ncbi:MAG: hypothetical protein RL596_1392 [Bacteroidota bacterium]|jgi:uncharacterized damage-inducible protein DinB
MKKQITFLVLLLASLAANAQLSETVKTQMIKDWERAKAYTKEYLDAMPKDQYGFKAQDSIRSFAQQMIHLSSGNVGIAATATGTDRPSWSSRPLERTASALSADSVNYFTLASYDFVIDAIKSMDASKLEEKIKRGNIEETRYAWLLKNFEHQTHHRGQATIYIRLRGIKPPNEKLF